MLSEISKTSPKMVVLDFGFMFNELVQHILCSNHFSVQSFLVCAFGIYYILAGMYRT